MKKNLFFIETIGLSDKFGIGTYSACLLPGIAGDNIFSAIYKVRVGLSHEHRVNVQKNDGITILTILLKKSQVGIAEEVDFLITQQMAKLCAGILVKENGEGKALAHINIATQFELASLLKKAGFVIVYTHHFSQPFPNSQSLSKPKAGASNFEAKILGLAGQVIFLSDQTKMDYQSRYRIPSRKASVICNGVPPATPIDAKQRIKAKRNFGFSSRDVLYLFVGRVTKEKGIFETLIAFKALAAENRNVHLLIAGTGDFQAAMHISLEKTANIHFLGYLPFAELQKIYMIADVGMLVSYQEQSSFAVLELINSGIPVIVSRINAFDNFRNNTEVLKVGFKKHQANITNVNLVSLFKAMYRLYSQKELRKTLSSNAKRKMQQVQSAALMIEKTRKVYAKLFSEEED